MRKLIIAFVMTMFGFAAAKAEISITMPTKAEVTRMIVEVNPVASPEEIDKCYSAVKSGGLHKVYSSKVTVYCTKSEVLRVFAQ